MPSLSVLVFQIALNWSYIWRYLQMWRYKRRPRNALRWYEAPIDALYRYLGLQKFSYIDYKYT